MTESWKRVWREGYAPLLGDAELRAMLDGLRRDDPRIMQGATSSPPPLHCVLDWPLEGGCILTYGGWRAGDYETVRESEEKFAHLAFAADQRLGEPAACRFWLNWYDNTERSDMLRIMILEVERELLIRGRSQCQPGHQKTSSA